MVDFDWRAFLQRWSTELLEVDEIRAGLAPEVVAAGWMGYGGATEHQLASAEARLGKRLPPSYRAFLRVSNGWRQTGTSIDRIWSTEDVEWFHVRNQGWIDAYVNPPLLRRFVPRNLPSVPDREYFIYGKEQDPARFRPEYLPGALEISAEGDSAIYLLNPQVVAPTGEWEAWFFANWLPGAARFRSFQEMMEDEHDSFLSLRGI